MAVKVKQHKGAWWIFIDHKGKRKAKRIGTSKRAAEQVAEKIQAKIALGQFVAQEEEKPILFADYRKRWLETHASVHCKSSTMHEYETIATLHLLPAFGKTPVGRISREDVKNAITHWLAKGLSHGRV